MPEALRLGRWSPAPLAQQGIWLNERRQDVGTAYHMPFTLSFEGELDRAALLAACRAVVARNPVLAGAFDERDGVPHIGPAELAPDVEVVDLSPAPPQRRGAALAEAIRAGILGRFDLRRGPLIRMTLFILGPSSHVLLVVVHHAVFDGESMELYEQELAACYRSGLSGEEQVAREPRLLAAELPAATAFWRERWRERPPVSLPGAARAAREAEPGECVETVVEAGLRARLDGASAAIGVTRFEFLLASLSGLLQRYGNRDPEITIALGTRTEDTAGCVGCFADELPLSVASEPDVAFRAFAADLRSGLRGLSRFRGIPLGRAVPGVRPGASHTAVSLSYRRHARTVPFPGLRVSAEWLFNLAARGLLWTQMLDEEDGVRVLFRYPPRVIAREEVERIAGDWRELLSGAIAAPDVPLGALPPSSPRALPRAEVDEVDAAEERAGALRGGPPADDGILRDLARIWQEVLRVERVGPQESLFDFGVNSLAIAQIAARIQQRMKVDIPLDVFYDAPTLAEIAAIVAEARDAGG